jgi:aminopeptidase N
VCCPLQCEATQFSLLTVVPDRPDILSLWRVRVEAPQASCPVLLSNGNMVGAGELQGGRHFTVWEVGGGFGARLGAHFP